MFWLKNQKNNFQLRTLIWGPGMANFSNSMYKSWPNYMVRIVDAQMSSLTLKAQITTVGGDKFHDIFPNF